LYQKTVLPSGVCIVTEEIPVFSSVAIGFWVNVGSKSESPAEAGISHLLEHLLFKGTGKYTSREIAELLDSVGGQLNAFTSKEHTCYYARVLTEHFSMAVDVLADMFLKPRLTVEDIAREKRVVQEEISMYEDSPDELVHDLLAQAVWPQHPLGCPVLGTRESIANLAPEKIHSFFRHHYTPDNLVISVTGNIEHAQVVATCEHYFNATSAAEVDQPSLQLPRFQAGSTVFTRSLEQVHICLGAPGAPIGDDTVYAIDVTNSILGGGLSSRLFQHIREERGLAYSVYSYHTAYQDSGLFTVYVGLRKDNAQAGLDLIRQELETIMTEPVLDQELQRAKQQILGNLFLGLESTTNRMIRLGKQELSLGRWVPLEEVQSKINAVTTENILNLCSQLFEQSSRAAVLLGPVETGDIRW
jgi:predicted Zn-dependent peptidase